jgi:hypothetical protein
MHRWLIGLVLFRELVAGGHARFLGPSLGFQPVGGLDVGGSHMA